MNWHIRYTNFRIVFTENYNPKSLNKSTGRKWKADRLKALWAKPSRISWQQWGFEPLVAAKIAQWASPYYIALDKWKRHLLVALAVSCTMMSPLGHVSVNEDAPRVLECPQDQPSFIDWAVSKKSFCQPPGIEPGSSAWLAIALTIVSRQRWNEGAKNNRSLSIFFFNIYAQKYILPFSGRLRDPTDNFFHQERSFHQLFVTYIVE